MQIAAGVLASFALLISATPTNINLPTTTSLSTLEINITSHVRNANHIFNALHSSMRQWGSAWHHNGMSFFLASVPEGTQFYHGTRSANRVNGTEWLAFEPEHALNFARMRPHGKKPGKGRDLPPPDHKQEVIAMYDDDNEEEEWGYLHTYTAAKDLRLLYIDGLSAGKTEMGTMDSGDRIFLRDENLSQFSAATEDKWVRQKKAGPGDEYARAVIGCEIAKNEWHDRIDGVVRAEAGFEIIMCDFERDLDLVRINAVQKEDDTFPQGFGNSGYFYRAIASRFDGIGGERVKVNYDNFVTAFTYEDLDLFDGGKNEMPRLNHFSSEQLQPFRDDLTKLVMENEITSQGTWFNWQAIADMIVMKYSNLLMYFVSDEIESLLNLQMNVTNIFLSFVDARHRDPVTEAERCAMQFIPALKQNTSASSHLARQAVYDVSHTICSTLRTILDDTDFGIARVRIKNLIEYLAWTTWKECKTKCSYNEACFIPIWPFGTVQDRLNPQCSDGSNRKGDGGERYWKPDLGKPPGRGHEEWGEL